MDAVGEEADVVIPEVVFWQWAEHAALAHATLQGQNALRQTEHS